VPRPPLATRCVPRLARQQDPALEPDDILAVGRYLDRLDDVRFTYYGLSRRQIDLLRRELAVWPRD